MKTLPDQAHGTHEYLSQPRFKGIKRLYTARQVDEQRGSIPKDYPVARQAAEQFYVRLRTLFENGKSITTFGPYSPGQAVVMKRLGIEGIYLGGWATSAKGSINEDPGPDLASYPLSQVPDEAAAIVRALLMADRNQHYVRSRMDAAEREATPKYDYRPFIIADADTGHGGESHVMNLIRRFVEIGVPGYHIEDQKPGVKKCGHQAGKVLVSQDEQIKRLNAARFQLDIMGVPGIIVARTDAEAATLIDGASDDRDHPFVLGVTNPEVPNYKVAFVAIMRYMHEKGAKEILGHELYRISDERMASAMHWLEKREILRFINSRVEIFLKETNPNVDGVLDEVVGRFVDIWQNEAQLKTIGEAVAGRMRFRMEEGAKLAMDLDEWNAFARTASIPEARARAASMGLKVPWDHEAARSPEGYYLVRGGIEYAIAKSLAAAPYADLIWMETKTANLKDAEIFSKAIHAVYPDKLLAYNLSPSFNWDTTGMSEEEMRRFPAELGKLGYVFNFITYGGHQVDGLASEEFATALQEDGMLALARLQRKLRLLNSPYRTPQSHVGGPRADGALMASTGRTATTKAMGKGSTQFQHLVQTEVPQKVLEGWLTEWRQHHGISDHWNVKLRPHTAGSDLLTLRVKDEAGKGVADIVFATLQDRTGRNFISVRDQNNHRKDLRMKRLMTLLHLFLIHRYKAVSLHFVSPTEDNVYQAEGMLESGIFSDVKKEVGHIIVCVVNETRITKLTDPEAGALKQLIQEIGSESMTA